ncbi:GMC family oxidoreductase [Hoyosella sp. YIM 151337]|uniref:GMC family oxidoreductase n=1 Tax=Hoyosella sp. YIM 151337 TaxID=2992742 RepID=UPI002235E95B|nr:GMC family oxidoreductase [Hoyosella sp. YIM 151337]MCW4354525.1 GMC family oxidoreductase [Hoyosella sp. YIM 151337]
MSSGDAPGESFDFIIVGSGAGGGPLAANLALAGHHVLLLEAGDDHQCVYYDAPIFHSQASEDADMRWDYFVRHYSDREQQARDPKFTAERDGVLYPRGGTLGGSTAISAMITVYPHNSDWDEIAELTGDESWRAARMRPLFERLESWRDPQRGYAETPPEVPDPARHGYHGWLGVTRANPAVGGREQMFLDIIDTMEQSSRKAVDHSGRGLEPPYDPNDWRFVQATGDGMVFIPVAVREGTRNGARERVLSAAAQSSGRLVVRLNSLVSKVLIEDGRATGVEYLTGTSLYRADPRALQGDLPPLKIARARHEVVLSAGAFNTPQLLMLSGIGPREELERHGLEVLIDSPGVGKNLQDRYEVTVVNRLYREYPIFAGSQLDAPQPGEEPDALFTEWRDQRDGPFTTNGTLAAYIKRSSVAQSDPDLFVFSLPVFFRGYYPNYSEDFRRDHNVVSWVILKAHTANTAGEVRLRSTDPRDTPLIDFHYFDEGNDPTGEDLDAVVEGIQFARSLAERLGATVQTEILPGDDVTFVDDLRRYVRDQAWGHHASCTARIGPDDDPMAVLDSRFRVRGVANLRVVDACAFPRIPGFFIATSVYMIAEKASDQLLSEYPPTKAVGGSAN